ncbi:Vesicle-associated protein 1-3 [Cucurbita argyrosperma subsp. argyrosperma]|uniref:Vesicle-associated protein 1-3-like n=3 Tax=Cucurbita TaxID=3660 RepID=A0A6J1KWF7_CUCMA|nr:vesicle-associated protein 1-3-like [Cucurbita moschata]XP_023006652.1 vesicle-associated protein 1-3-like [Cucurbita maxima]XP_023547648.1 vesicle-associated protein 1-3-like [Cucurbita pepo subsp. pepo]KAG7013783.1 Vesicle-associated protein 1-3 [Cucurbita argyrosperma subsp. argyrosperma]
MNSGDYINIQPSELKFQFELKKQSSCSLHLTNKTDKYVAFKVKTTNPKKYCVRPNAGIILPSSISDITVTMQAPKEMPSDMQCKDKFLIQSAIAPDGTTAKDISAELFNKGDGKVVDDFKMRVVYIFANPPSPVPEGSEEGSPSRTNAVEDGNQNFALFDAVSRSLDEPKEISSQVSSNISKLTEEKAAALQQNQKLRQELELLKKETSGRQGGGFSVLFVVLIGLIGVLIGYLVKKT